MESEITLLSIIKDNFSAITAILGALVSGVFTWVIAKYQFKIKKYELESNVEFEARKLLFNSFKANFEKYTHSSEEMAKSFGEIYSSFVLQGFNENLSEVKKMCETFKKIIKTFSSPSKELQNELLNLKASQEILEKLGQIESIYKKLIDPKREVKDYEEEFLLLGNYYRLMNEVEAEAIILKSDSLFEKYLK
jgi:hypothetical protein